MRFTALGMAGLVSVLALIFTSCQKEISGEGLDDPKTDTTCKLSKITYFDSTGAVDDTAGITYALDKISRVGRSQYSFDLIYTNGRVSRINYSDVAGTPYDFFDSVSYNNAGKIESLIFYTTSTGIDSATGGYEIFYNGDGTPSKVVEKTTGTTGLEDSYEYQYNYTQQNVSMMVVTELATADILPLAYTSDNTTNIFSKFPAEFIFADNYLFGISGVQFGFFSPFMFSKNNIATLQSVAVTYEKDGKGNITAILLGNQKLVAYSYKCQ